MILMQFYNLEVIKNKEIRILKIAIINFKTCKIINKFTGSRHLEFLKYSYKQKMNKNIKRTYKQNN